MNLAPINVSTIMMKNTLMNGHPIRVVLEPGDATRYELLLIPQSGEPYDTFTGNSDTHIIIVRNTGGTLSAVNTTLHAGEYWPGQFAPISNNNEHTQDVIAEFMAFLMKELHTR